MTNNILWFYTESITQYDLIQTHSRVISVERTYMGRTIPDCYNEITIYPPMTFAKNYEIDYAEMAHINMDQVVDMIRKSIIKYATAQGWDVSHAVYIAPTPTSEEEVNHD